MVANQSPTYGPLKAKLALGLLPEAARGVSEIEVTLCGPLPKAILSFRNAAEGHPPHRLKIPN